MAVLIRTQVVEERKSSSSRAGVGGCHRELVDVLPGHTDAPTQDTNPVVDSMRVHLAWPPVPFDERSRPWVERVEAVRAGRLAADDLLTDLAARELYASHLATIEALEAERAEEAPTPRPRSLPATAAVRVASGALKMDAVLHPLPERPTQAQRLGTEVHSWIEEVQRGLIGLADEEALDAPSLAPDAATVRRLREHFVALSFPGRTLHVLDSGETATELPFTLKVGEVLVRGRIDAVYDGPDGTLEIVDFKTGAMPDTPDWAQLEIYAEALAALGIATGPVTLTYAFLLPGELRSVRFEPAGLDRFVSSLPG